MFDILAAAPTRGHYFMSIGTSLAFEGLFNTGEYGPTGAKPRYDNTLPITTVNELGINLRTLVRNAIQSYASDAIGGLRESTIVNDVQSDWGKIQDLLANAAPNVTPWLYLCRYEKLERHYPHARFKEANTEKQRLIESIEHNCYRKFCEMFGDKSDASKRWQVFDWKLSGSADTVLLTHLSLDLLSNYNFPQLRLLESHTGLIKTKREWNTKLALDKSIQCIPFNAATLQIFGDNGMFKPQDLKVRKLLLAIGERRRWHPLTPLAKMIEDIKLEYEPWLLEFVLRYK